jgi:hypothetical protein
VVCSPGVDSRSDALLADSKHGALGAGRSLEAPECVSRFTPDLALTQCRKNVSVRVGVAARGQRNSEAEVGTGTSVDVD